jgi:hypothetical protein
LSSHPGLPNFVAVAISQFFGCLTVVGWSISQDFQSVHEDVTKFLSASKPFQIMGLDLLNAAVMEMSYATSTVKKLPKHRKTGISFDE